MKSTRTRLVGVAAALSTVAIAAPVSTASAATVPIMGPGWGGITAPPFTGGPVGEPAAGVVGATIITTAPTTFIDTHNQVSAADNWSGGQLGR